MKTLHCRDAGFDCGYEIQAQSEEEVLRQAAEHARMVHQVQVTPDMAAQIRKLIRDKASDASGDEAVPRQ